MRFTAPIGTTIFGAFVAMGLLIAALGGYGLYVLQAAGGFIFPATHATGVQWIGELGGMCDARVTRFGSGDPSAATPLLYRAQ